MGFVSVRSRVTTFEPGARLVFTHGRTPSPRATALRARRPAASITEGFEVLVQLVIAAITTAPCPRWPRSPPISIGTVLARSPSGVGAGGAAAIGGPPSASQRWP